MTALTACELALGGRQELLEHADGASSVDEFWARIEPVLRMRLARRHRRRRLGELIGETNPSRRFIAVVALLLGRPAPGPSGFGWLGPKGSWHTDASPSDASDVLRRLKAWDAARRAAQIRRPAAALAVACALSVYLSIRVGRQAAELADARRKVEQVEYRARNNPDPQAAELADARRKVGEGGDQLAEAKLTIASQAKRITELERQVAGAPPAASGAGTPSADKATDEIGRQARNAWEEKFTVKHPYQANDVTKLYESWRTKEPAVAGRIKQWFTSIEALQRRMFRSRPHEVRQRCDRGPGRVRRIRSSKGGNRRWRGYNAVDHTVANVAMARGKSKTERNSWNWPTHSWRTQPANFRTDGFAFLERASTALRRVRCPTSARHWL
ncbi:MAG TPA: hypothetical protein VMV69_13230 [Pirellulales bacterium]|nr:hypothetical protein [Pirellulales bacterium]